MGTRKSRTQSYTGTVADLVNDGFSQLEELASEAREIVDNASGTNLENTGRVQTFDQTASTLEYLSAPHVPDDFGAVPVAFIYTVSRRTGRAQRCSDACDYLRHAVEALQALEQDDHPQHALWGEHKDDIEELVQELENAIGEAENCEFPGMFG